MPGTAYNTCMARGWESKSIEDQIELTRAEKEKSSAPGRSEAELQRQAKRKGLLTSEASILRELESATDERYRSMLEISLAHVKEALSRLELDKPDG